MNANSFEQTVLTTPAVCPVCKTSGDTIIRNKLRYGVVRDVIRCDQCEFVFLWPRMGKSETVDFYKKGDYHQTPRDRMGLQIHDADATFETRMGQARQRYELTKPYLSPNARMLEVGSGSGSFCSLVKKDVKEYVGIELDPPFAEYVRNRFGVQVLENPISELPDTVGRFDVICMWFVLEHLHDPLHDLRTLLKFIQDDGVLLMLLPNLLDPLVSIYKVREYEDFFYQLAHLNYFSPKTMRLALDTSGWAGKVSPIQIYGLANHMRWMFFKRPQKFTSRGNASQINLIDRMYRKYLSNIGRTDSLLVSARKDKRHA